MSIADLVIKALLTDLHEPKDIRIEYDDRTRLWDVKIDDKHTHLSDLIERHFPGCDKMTADMIDQIHDFLNGKMRFEYYYSLGEYRREGCDDSTLRQVAQDLIEFLITLR